MNILIDIGHPAHIHLFKNLYFDLKDDHNFLFTIRDKEITLELAEYYNLPKFVRYSGSNNFILKPFFLAAISFQLLRISKERGVDLFFGGPGNVYVSCVSKILNVRSIIFDDTEHATIQLELTKLFCNKIYTPHCYRFEMPNIQEKYYGFHEYSYLSREYFSPDSKILDEVGLKKEDKFAIIRFVAWNALHDKGHKGLSIVNKILLVKMLSRYCKVFLTSEKPLPKILDKYKIKVSPEKMHNLLSFSSLLYGESATMASEAAMLGVPSIFVDNNGRGYTDNLEKEHGLVFNFTEDIEGQQKSIKKAIEIISRNNKEKWKRLATEMNKKLVNPVRLMKNNINE